MNPIETLLLLLAVYAAIGLVIGLVFVALAGRRIDPRLHGSGRLVRLVLLPGAVLLWPIIAARLIRGQPEGNPQ